MATRQMQSSPASTDRLVLDAVVGIVEIAGAVAAAGMAERARDDGASRCRCGA